MIRLTSGRPPGPPNYDRAVPVLPRSFSPATVSRLALLNAVANGLIVVTGGLVRLTGSGLGCPTWPRCTDDSFVTTPEMAGHGMIEFGNRLLTFVLAAAAIATVVAVWRSPRRDLRVLAALTFLGIPAQAALGGVTVLTGLNPWTVAAHFLVSAVLVALATTLWLRSREPGVGQPLLRRPFVLLVGGIAAATAAVLVMGTVVTGSGPHSGDVPEDPDAAPVRMGFDPELVSQLHADAVFLLLGLTIALLVALHATDPATPYLSLWARLPGFASADLDAALRDVFEVFRRDLTKYEAAVLKVLDGQQVLQHEFDAAVSFHFNTGAIALYESLGYRRVEERHLLRIAE